MRPRRWAWTSTLSPRAFDLVLVAVLTILGVISTLFDPFARRGPLGQPWNVLLAIGLLLLQTIPLYWRRRRPNLVLLVVSGAFALKYLLGINSTIASVGLLIGIYSVAVYGRRRVWALVVAGLFFVAGFVVFAVTGNPKALALSVPAVFHVAAWLVGDYLRTRRDYVAALEERAASLERDRELDRQHAADEERARIARELHDVVAHDVSVIAIQAGAARTVHEAQPEAAAEALNLIESTARKTLVELNQLLGVLRKADGAAPQRAPQPGLAQVPILIEELRAAGVAVNYRIDGEATVLPQALDLSAYRILQESTTNILKHAHAGHVEILLSYRADEIGLRVRDDGTGEARPNGRAPGHGLIGMRERVELFGGELKTGPLKGGGFEVMVRLPIQTGL